MQQNYQKIQSVIVFNFFSVLEISVGIVVAFIGAFLNVLQFAVIVYTNYNQFVFKGDNPIDIWVGYDTSMNAFC